MAVENEVKTGYCPPGCAEEWVEIEGRKVRYLRSGHGEPLVLVHGLLGYSFSWRRVVAAFAGVREVFAPDLPGSGFSECRTGLDCGLAAAADRLGAFMDAAGISSCDVVASSYGGATALMLASQQPWRFRRLVLAAPANPWSRIGKKRIMLLRIPLVRWLFPKVGRRARFLHDFFLRRLYGDPRAIAPETYRGYSAPIALGGRLEHAIRIVQTWAEDMEALRLALPAAVEIPVLLVWGRKDRAVDAKSAELLARSFRQHRIVLIEDAGHLPYEETPGEFVRIVTEFLSVPNGR